MREVILGVPFYKNVHLVDPIVRSIKTLRVDKAVYNLSIVFVIDSPSDVELVSTLRSASDQLSSFFPAALIINEVNLGFVRSANIIMARAIERNADVILVNSDVLLFEDTVQEMLDVAGLDSMIGFVSPRTNDTTICTFPLPGNSNGDPAALYSDFRALAPRLPRLSYVPTAVGFCLLIKANILQEFSGFDLIFSPGYNEENDLIMRANRYGYRAVIANWAYAYHEGGASFSLADHGPSELERRNGAILAQRHAHYYPSIRSYFNSPEHRALVLISQLREKPRWTVAFDASDLGLHKNGTTEYNRCVVRSFAKLFGSKYQVFVICDPSVWKFHEFDKIDGLNWSPVDSDEQFAAVIRLSQPFNLRSIVLAPSRGAIVIFSMLDAIAYDCLDLCTAELSRLWQFVMQYSDVVIYISKFTKDQFARRFASGPEVRHAVSLPSTDPDEYRSAYSDSSEPGTYLLLIGNHFAHKAIRETVYMLRDKLPDEELKVLGIALPELPDVVSLQSGGLHDSAVWQLYSRAKAVVFPSHYEGFGLPVLHALGNRKVIFVRDLPVYHEIGARIPTPDNIRVFRTNQDLARQLADADFEWKESDRVVTDVGWDRAAHELEAEFAAAARSTSAGKIQKRLESLALLTESLDAHDRRAVEEARALAIRKDEELQQAREELNAVHRSTSWRLTAPLRRLRSRIASTPA